MSTDGQTGDQKNKLRKYIFKLLEQSGYKVIQIDKATVSFGKHNFNQTY